MKILLYIATIIGVCTYMFWTYFPKGSFYYGNALFIFLLCIIIFLQNRKLFISFFLICASFSNLLDELLFDNTKLGLNELALIIVIPAIWLYKTKNDREIKPV